MISPTTFHEDVFYEHFRPFQHDESEVDIWGGIGLETYGQDLQLLRSYPAECVWSVFDSGDGPDQWIAPGIHFVNRVCYVLTKVPHDWADVQFRVHHDLKSLTAIGLKSRLSTLRKTLLIHSADSKNNWTQLEAAKHRRAPRPAGEYRAASGLRGIKKAVLACFHACFRSVAQ